MKEEKKPDSVVFDDNTQTYNAHIIALCQWCGRSKDRTARRGHLEEHQCSLGQQPVQGQIRRYPTAVPGDDGTVRIQRPGLWFQI